MIHFRATSETKVITGDAAYLGQFLPRVQDAREAGESFVIDRYKIIGENSGFYFAARIDAAGIVRRNP